METKKEQIIISRLGEKRIDPGKVIYFPRGLVGFEESRQFTLIQICEESPFLLLQDIETPELGLIVTDPFAFLSEYSVKVSDSDAATLQASDIKNLSVLVTVSIPPGEPANTCINLSGPILVNRVAKRGVQAPQVDPRATSRVLLRELQDVNATK